MWCAIQGQKKLLKKMSSRAAFWLQQISHMRAFAFVNDNAPPVTHLVDSEQVIY